VGGTCHYTIRVDTSAEVSRIGKMLSNVTAYTTNGSKDFGRGILPTASRRVIMPQN